MKDRLKLRKLALHASVFATFLLYNNCSGFTAKELESLNASSVGTPNGAAAPTPTPVPLVSRNPVATPDPTAQRTKVFIAQGKLGRTVMSCDGGRTWINDESDEPNKICWMQDSTDPRNVECDHNPMSSVGIDAGDGWIFSNWGWGYAGSVRRSSDGLHWQILNSAETDPNKTPPGELTDSWGGGLAYAQGKLLVVWDAWHFSLDAGSPKSWQTFLAANRPPDAIIADHAHAHRLGNKYAIVANSGIAISADLGQTWVSTPSLGWPPTDIAEGNGSIVAIGAVNRTYPGSNSLHAMTSTDGGRTWTDIEVFSAQYARWNQLLFNGSQFVAYAGATRWTSNDGITWTATPINVTGTYSGGAAWVAMGAIGFNSATGTYVSITTEWSYWYDKQRAYISTDGINWTELDSNHFKGGHPIYMITTADIDSKYCL